MRFRVRSPWPRREPFQRYIPPRGCRFHRSATSAIIWGCETLCRTVVAAVDGIAAVATVAGRGAGGSHPASVLPPSRQTSLHDAAQHHDCHGTGRAHGTSMGSATLSLAAGGPASGGGHGGVVLPSGCPRDSGCASHSGSSRFLLEQPCANAVDTRPSIRASLNLLSRLRECTLPAAWQLVRAWTFRGNGLPYIEVRPFQGEEKGSHAEG